MAVRTNWYRRRVSAALAAGALVLVACGGDDDGDSSGDTTTAAPATDAPASDDTTAPTAAPEDTTAPTDGSDATTAPTAAPDDTTPGETTPGDEVDAQARVDAFRQPVAELPFDEPVALEPGKTLFYVQCSVPVCAEIAIGLEAAAEAAGWTYETASHQDTPETVASAFDAAIAAQPDVVMTSGNPREWFASQLSTLEEQGVPVVAWSMPEGFEPGDGVDVNLLTNDDYYFYGVLMADYAATTTESKQIQFIGLPTFPVLSTVQQGFEDEIAIACPDCSVDITEVAVTDIGTNLPGTIVSALQSNPELDTIVYAFGGMLFGVPEALESAQLSDQAKGVSQAGGPMNFTLIKNGQHQVAEVGIASELLGWRAIDAAARIMAGDGPGQATAPPEATVDGHPDTLVSGLPLQILEADTIDDPSVLWVGVEGFQDQFKELWGV
jgi:ribose transport system substrate-binding protein